MDWESIIEKSWLSLNLKYQKKNDNVSFSIKVATRNDNGIARDESTNS